MDLRLKGVFARSRRDFQIEKCMYGGTHSNTTSAVNFRASLYNNTTSGKILAVYGILAWLSLSPQIVNCDVEFGKQDNVVELQQPVFSGAPALDGQVLSSQSVINNQGTIRFAATGDKWLTLGGDPMFILNPNYSLCVWTIGVTSTLHCAFLWGYY